MILKQLVTLSSPKQKAVELMKTHNYMPLGSATLPPSLPPSFLPFLSSPSFPPSLPIACGSGCKVLSYCSCAMPVSFPPWWSGIKPLKFTKQALKRFHLYVAYACLQGTLIQIILHWDSLPSDCTWIKSTIKTNHLRIVQKIWLDVVIF